MPTGRKLVDGTKLTLKKLLNFPDNLPPRPTSWLLMIEPAAAPARAAVHKRKRRTRDRSETGRNAGSVSYPIQVRGRAPILPPPTAPRADLTAARRGVWGFRPPVSLTGSAPDHLWVTSEVSPTRLSGLHPRSNSCAGPPIHATKLSIGGQAQHQEESLFPHRWHTICDPQIRPPPWSTSSRLRTCSAYSCIPWRCILQGCTCHGQNKKRELRS